MTGVAKIGKHGAQKADTKKQKSMLDVVEAARQEIDRKFPGFSSYHALKLAKLLAQNKDNLK